MTLQQVRELGADLLGGAFTEIPDHGWQELDKESIATICDQAQQAHAAAKNKDDAANAKMIEQRCKESLDKINSGARIFSVVREGVRAFAATTPG